MSFAAFVLVAITALAAPSPVARKEDFNGIATFFYQNGIAGACGKVHQDTDHVVALHTNMYDEGAHCGKTIVITNTKTGATRTGVIADECPTCNGDGCIDLSSSLFDEFASAEQGIFPVSWHFQ